MHPRLDCFHAVPVLAIAIVPNWHLLSLLNFTCMYHQERTNKDKGDILKTVSRVEYYCQVLVCKHGKVLPVLQ